MKASALGEMGLTTGECGHGWHPDPTWAAQGWFGCCVGTRLQDRQREGQGCHLAGHCRHGASDKVKVMKRVQGLDTLRFSGELGVGCERTERGDAELEWLLAER